MSPGYTLPEARDSAILTPPLCRLSVTLEPMADRVPFAVTYTVPPENSTLTLLPFDRVWPPSV